MSQTFLSGNLPEEVINFLCNSFLKGGLDEAESLEHEPVRVLSQESGGGFVRAQGGSFKGGRLEQRDPVTKCSSGVPFLDAIRGDVNQQVVCRLIALWWRIPFGWCVTVLAIAIFVIVLWYLWINREWGGGEWLSPRGAARGYWGSPPRLEYNPKRHLAFDLLLGFCSYKTICVLSYCPLRSRVSGVCVVSGVS